MEVSFKIGMEAIRAVTNYNPAAPGSLEAIREIALGQHDASIRMAVELMVENGVAPTANVDLCVGVLKKRAAMIILPISTLADLTGYLQQGMYSNTWSPNGADQEKLRKRAEAMAALSAKHAAGTTAEIATLLKTTKAQVRKWKADGELDSRIATAVELKDMMDGVDDQD